MTGNRLMPLGPRQIVPAIVLTNVGLLAALICGPNSTHPNVLGARLGIGIMVIGLALLAGVALSRKPPRGVPR